MRVSISFTYYFFLSTQDTRDSLEKKIVACLEKTIEASDKHKGVLEKRKNSGGDLIALCNFQILVCVDEKKNDAEKEDISMFFHEG